MFRNPLWTVRIVVIVIGLVFVEVGVAVVGDDEDTSVWGEPEDGALEGELVAEPAFVFEPMMMST